MTALALIAHKGASRLAFVQADRFRLLPKHLATVDDALELGCIELRKLDSSGLYEIPRDDSWLLAPTPSVRRDILCTGWNYWDHFEEGKGRREGQDVDPPEHPTFFTKGPNTIVGPQDAIAFDPVISSKWDYEVEVALIIGKSGRSITQDEALDHVFAYCLANDVSQRDLQRAHGGQWLKGKSIDSTMPIGPYLTLADDVDPTALEIQCELNGECMQQASTSQMAFPVRELISELSFGMTLQRGDVILTGTPAGVGNARTPQVFLKADDQLVCYSPQLGELRNQLVLTDLHSASIGRGI